MDPKAVWEKLIEAAQAFVNLFDSVSDEEFDKMENSDYYDMLATADEMATAAVEMQEWVSKGGPWPTASKKEATSVDATWERIDRIVEIVGADMFIEMYIKAEEDQHVNNTLDYVVDANELKELFEEEDLDEED